MAKIAFLPFNVAEPVKPAFGRQLANFLREAMKVQPKTETNYLSALAEVGEEGRKEAAFVNFGDTLNDAEFVRGLLKQTDAEYGVDGLLKGSGENYTITLRVTKKEDGQPKLFERDFALPQVFDTLKWMIQNVSEATGTSLLPDFVETMDFGTEDAESFRDFLIGFDAIAYIAQAGFQVARAFDVGLAFDSLISSLEKDKDFLGPYESALQLAKLSAEFGIGSYDIIEQKLKRLIDLVPDDWRAYYVMGDIALQSGRPDIAAEKIDKAASILEQQRRQAEKERQEGKDVEIPQPEPALYARLGLAQQALGMVVNAERSYKRALELEGPDKPTMDLLSNLLVQMGRAHEVPLMWQEVVSANPERGDAWAKYAISLVLNQNEAEARKVFEEGMQKTGGAPVLKRYYAPFLASKQEYDRAMDLYEDCLELMPKDIPLLIEYAQTLAQAGRVHEVPDVLNRILASEPDENTRANVKAWLYELSEPRRLEIMKTAYEKTEREDFAGAIADLEPLTEWLDDYWKPYLLLASLYNRVNRFEDAERAARKTIQIFPACEAAYVELATAQSGQGRDEEAYNGLASVLRVLPHSLPIALNLAIAAKKTGRTEEARRLASRIRASVGEDNIEVAQVIKEIESP